VSYSFGEFCSCTILISSRSLVDALQTLFFIYCLFFGAGLFDPTFENRSGKPKNIVGIAFSLNAGRIRSMYLIDPSGILHSYLKKNIFFKM